MLMRSFRRALIAACCCLLLAVTLIPARAQTSPDCPDAPDPRLVPGQNARVTPGDPNTVRDAPTTGGVRVGSIPGGGSFAVLEGPVCADGYYWWQVTYEGITGWTVEGADGIYWTEPLPPKAPLPVRVSIGPAITRDNPGALDRVLEPPCEWAPDEVNSFSYGVSISPDGTKLAYGCGLSAANVHVFNLQTMRIEQVYSGLDDVAYKVFFTADGERLIALDRGYQIHLWDLTTGENIATVEQGVTRAAAISPDGTLLATNSRDVWGVTLWDTAALDRVADLEARDGFGLARGIAFSPDGTMVAAAGDSGTVMVWLVQSGGLVLATNQRPEPLPDWVDTQARGVTFTPDGLSLITTDCERADRGECFSTTVVVWDLVTGTESTRWQYDEIGHINYAALLPGGDVLAAGTYGNLKLIDMASGTILTTLGEFREGGEQIAVSPDGTFFVAGADRAIVWGVPPADGGSFWITPPPDFAG